MSSDRRATASDVLRPRNVGAPIRRTEDPRLLTGNGEYTADRKPDRPLHLAFLRSVQPHARIVQIDAAAAQEAPGVVAVLTAEDIADDFKPVIPFSRMPNYYATPILPLASGKVRYVGEAVVAVVATSRYLAEDALELIEVDYEPLGAVARAEMAVAEGAPLLHEEAGTNVLLAREFKKGDVAADLEAAAVRLGGRFEMTRKAPLAMEPRSYSAEYEKRRDALTLYTSSNIPGIVRDAISESLSLPGHRLRVVALDVGGSFGSKGSLYPEELLICIAARKLRRSIKWTADRLEDISSSSQAFAEIIDAEMGFNANGVATSLQADVIGDVGAFSIYPWTCGLEPVQVVSFLPRPCKNPIDAMVPLLNRGGMMKGFVQEADRQQTTLLPECLDDWVGQSNPVRAVDVFVDALELRDLGFDGVDPAATGRPAYHPSPMLKLYIYGYLNRVQSSRRLEREAGRNLEVMWLTGRLVPDHKTIADFRKDNGPAIKKVCARFVELCRKMGLLAKASVAVDGSKFKAVNSRDNNFTQGKIKRRQKQIEESVARYMSQLDTADRRTTAGEDPSEAVLLTKTRLKEKLAKLEEEVKRLAAIEKALLASPDKQISLTDPDCRSMATSGRGSGMVAYNVQSAVDTTNHLIVAHEVTNVGTDRSQLATMAQAAKAALRSDNLDVVADRGYFKGEEILACEQAGVAVTLPKPQTSGAKSAGRFGKPDFVYLAKDDVYRCPAGEKLEHHFTADEDGQKMRIYLTKACRICPLKDQCTTANERRIKRWEHEHVVEAVQARLDQNPQAMRLRRETVEHPFATLKMRMGATHFLMKTLPKVATEMALHVLAYNLTRVMNIVGIKPLLAAVRA